MPGDRVGANLPRPGGGASAACGEGRMRIRASGRGSGVALLLGLWSAAPTTAQGTGALAVKTVHGKVEMINPS